MELLDLTEARRHDAKYIVREPVGPTRRRFLQGAAVASGVAAAGIPSWLAAQAGAATPIGTNEGVLVVVDLLGGNDTLNTLVPRTGADRSRYDALRLDLAQPVSSLLPIDDGSYGFHKSLPGLASRFAEGKVAVIRGVGTNGNLSHFLTQATMMAGTTGTDRTTGWLGRYTDGLTEWDSGFREVAVGSIVPLHLVGSRAKVTALPSAGSLWGSDQSWNFENTAYNAMRAFAATPTGLGPLADKVAAINKTAIDHAATFSPLYAGMTSSTPLSNDLTFAARLINADLGTRCVTVERQGWDTHASQAATHASLLTELDGGLTAFFAALSPGFRRRVTVLVVSEFGRRAARNASFGTDHGNAGIAFVMGDNVKGGLYGANPSLTTFDPSGNLVPTVDVRSVYASVLEPWLAGDASGTLGSTYEQLGLFTAGPGATPAA